MYKRKLLASIALAAVAMNTINFTFLEDRLGEVRFAPEAHAANAQNLGCNQPVLNGDPNLSQLINCWVQVNRPAGDTGATDMELGVHFENAFPGISSVANAGPEFACTQDQPTPGNKRLDCKTTHSNSMALGQVKQIDFVMHVVGSCGSHHEINATVANVYGVNSALITAPIDFPQCPPTFAQGSKSGPATVVAGQDITYQISFTNGGPTTQQNIRIADVIPPGLTFKSAGSTGGCAVTNGVVFCPQQSVAPGGTVSATLVFTTAANLPANTVIDNAADLQQNGNSFQWTNHRQTTVTSPAPVFAQGTKTAVNTIQPGQDITYTISFTNGGATQQNIRIADVIPPGLTFKSAGSTGGCAVSGGVVYCPAQTVNAGATISATLVFTVAANTACNAVIDNAADLQQNNASFQWTNHKQTTVQCPGPVFPQGTKSGPNTVVAGNDITYTISFTNQGTTQSNIRIADVIPPGLTFKSAGSTGGCAVTGGVVYCPAQTVNAGATISATLVFTTAANLPAGTIIDNAADLQQNNASFQWTNHVQTTVQSAAPNFPQGTKTAVNTIQPGQDITYTISFTNAGGTQQNIRIADVIPPNLTFKSAGSTGGCAVSGGVVYCPAQTVNAGATISATLVFTVAANTACNAVIDNAADLQQNNASFQWTNHKQTTVQCPGPVFPQGTKSGPNTVVAGNDITYTISFTNQGTTQSNIRIADVIPAGLTFKSAGSTAGCAVTAGVVFCPAQTVNAGATISATLVFTTAANLPAGTIIDNAADLQQNNASFQWTNHVQTTVQSAAPNFPQGTKTAVNTIQPGQDITYTISFTNQGATQQNIRIADVIPPNLTFKSAGSTAGCAVTAGVVFCPAQTVNAGATISATLVFTVAANTPCNAVIDNAADLQQNNASFQWTNHKQTTVQCPAPSIDASLVKTKLSPATVTPGAQVVYDIAATNNGPSTGPYSAIITDTVPAGTSFVSASDPACQLQGTNVVCTYTNVTAAVGSTGHIQLTFLVGQNFACNGTLTNSATIAIGGGASDPNAGNNTSAVQSTVTCPGPNFPQGTKTVDKSVAAAGDVITYTISFTNQGTTQQNIRIADVVPAGLTFVTAGSTAGCAVSNGVVYCPAQTVNAGATISATLKFQIAANAACNAVIDNTADLQQNNASFQWTNHAQTTVQCQSADLVVTKTVSAPTAPVNTNVTFTVSVTNNGPAASQNVVLTDVLPAGLTYVTDATAQGTYNPANGQWTIGTLNAGATATLQIVATVATTGQKTNTATVTALTADPNLANNTASATVNGTQQTVDVSLVKTKADPIVVNPGSIVTYDLAVTNAGPGTTFTATVTDAIPAGTTFVAAGSTTGCSQQGNNVVCTLNNVTLNVGATTHLTLKFQVPANAACGPNANIVNTASIALNGVTDPNTADNSSSVTSNVGCPPPNFTQGTKTVDKTVAAAGDVITYTISFTNQGTDQQNIRIADVIPAGLTFVTAGSTAGCAVSNGVVYCPAQTVAAGASISATLKFQISANAACNSIIDDVADLQQNNTSFQWTNHAQTTVQCAQSADLAVTKTVSSANVPVNTNVTFTVSVTNNGPAASQNVVLTDVLPAGLTYVTHATAQGAYNQNTGTWTIGTMNSGATAVLQIVATVTTTNAVTNNATVTALTADPNLANNSASATVNGTQQTVDLSLAKTIDPNTVPTPGGVVNYDIAVTNNGPGTTYSATVTDVIPAGTTFVPAGSTAGCAQQGNNVVCALTNVTQAVGTTNHITLKFQLPANAACGQNATIANTASITLNGVTDPNTGNNTATYTSSVVCPIPTFTATKSVDKTVAAPGDFIVYTINAQNTGGVSQQNIRIADVIPAGLTFVTAGSTAGCVVTNGVVYCPAQTVTAGGTVSATLKFQINPGAQCSSTIDDIADIQQNGTSFTWTNHAQTQVQCAQTNADLTITKTGPATLQQGQQISYVITVTNNGPATATAANVNDTLPDGLSYVGYAGDAGVSCALALPGGGGTGFVGCSMGDIAAGQSKHVTLTFNVALPQTCVARTLTNVATVSSGSPDPNTANNSGAATTQLTCPVQNSADVSVVKTGPSLVLRGNNVEYTVNVSNAGPTAASNVVVTDVVPMGLTFAAFSGNAVCQQITVNNAAQVQCTLATLASGATEQIRLTFATQAPGNNCSAMTVTNTATVTSNTPDPNLGNNSSSVFTTVNCPGNRSYSETKTGPATVRPGERVTYTVTLTNQGNVTENIRIGDHIPSNLTFVMPGNGSETTAGCAPDGQGNIFCAYESFAPGQTRTYKLQFQVPTTMQCGSVIDNIADAQEGGASFVWSNHAYTTVICDTDLSVSKSANTTTPTVGGNVTFTVTALNNGPGTAANVRINDLLPAGLTYVSATPNTGTYNQNTGVWTVGNMNSGASATLQVVATVASAGTFTNTASGTFDGTDTNPGNNSASVTVTAANASADLGVTKSASTTTPTVGTNVTFTIAVTNYGPSAASNARVTDVLPAGLTYVSATPSTGSYNQTNGTWTIGTLNNGATATLQIVATAATQGTVINTATVTSDTQDTVTTNNSSSVTVVIGGTTTTTADLSVTKSGPSSANRGDSLTYVITAYNSGPNTANNVVVKDNFTSGIATFSSASGAQCSLSGSTQIYCTIATMTAGQSTPITVIFTTPSQTTCTTGTVTDSAVVSSSTTDPNAGNNTSASVSTTINCPQPNLNVTKSDGRSSANVNDVLNYTITITNSTNVAATNVTVTDNLPSGLTSVSAGNGGSVNGTQITWTNQTVPANGTLTLTVNGTVQNVGNGTQLTNYVYVTGTNLTGNLSAQDSTTVYSNTVYNPPPIYNPPPVYNPPPTYQPPVYNNPPITYQPPVYTPPTYKPVFPQTGTSDLYGTPEDTSKFLSKPETADAGQQGPDFSLIFFSTLAGIFAVGTAAASKLAAGGGLF